MFTTGILCREPPPMSSRRAVRAVVRAGGTRVPRSVRVNRWSWGGSVVMQEVFCARQSSGGLSRPSHVSTRRLLGTTTPIIQAE